MKRKIIHTSVNNLGGLTQRLLQITQGIFEWNGVQYFFEGNGFENRAHPFRFKKKGPHPVFLQYNKNTNLKDCPTLFLEAEAVPVEKIFWFNPKYSEIIEHKSITILVDSELKVYMKGSILTMERTTILCKDLNNSETFTKKAKEEFRFIKKISDKEREVLQRKRDYYFGKGIAINRIGWGPAYNDKI